jgi:hypothetical protein
LVTEREVDVPFLLSGISLARVFPDKEAHVEAMGGKIVIHFLSYLKVLQENARSNDGKRILTPNYTMHSFLTSSSNASLSFALAFRADR